MSVLQDVERFVFFKNFTLVVVADVEDEGSLAELSRLLWNWEIPLVVASTIGLMGYVRVQIRQHCVRQTHPDDWLLDLRLDNPPSALRHWVDSLDLSTLGNEEHSHVPWLLLLLKFLDQWRAKTGATFPKTYAEKKEVKALLAAAVRSRDDGTGEENFAEANSAINTALTAATIPDAVHEIFRYIEQTPLSESATPFFVVMRAIRDFANGSAAGGMLPRSGSLPDMFSDSKSYLRLQSIYREQSKCDAEEVHGRVVRLQEELAAGAGNVPAISFSFTEYMCKNAYFVQLIRTTALVDELEAGIGAVISYQDPPDNHQLWYLAFRIYLSFVTRNRRRPSVDNETSSPADLDLMLEWLPLTVVPDGDENVRKLINHVKPYLQEMTRSGGEHLCGVSSLIGGIAAQEIIKLITSQYVPQNNTLVYCGITNSTQTMKF